ncbi:ABC transporter ATP-binding protein [Micromonospora sp. KC213]|nr:ABC transporter ATP-binding protein [Micromonospora sp. KC213]
MRRMLGITAVSLRLTWRAYPLGTVLGVGLTVALAGVAAGTAVSQRWLIDSAGMGMLPSLISAVALGVAVHIVTLTLGRIAGNLRVDLADRVAATLVEDILTATAKVPDIEHLERPEHLNRLSLLRRGAWALAWSCWSLAETACAVASLALSAWLLVDIHPVLIVLVIGTAPVLLAGRRAQRLLGQARDEVAGPLRQEAQLHDLCIKPDPAKEVWIAGAGPELDRMARAAWQTATRREVAARLRGLVWSYAGWATYAAGLAVAVIVVADAAMHHRASVGDVVLVLSLSRELRSQAAGTIGGLGAVAEAGRIAGHYNWLRQYAASRQRSGATAPDRLTSGIRLRGVTFCYPGTDIPVLQDVDMDLPAGATIALVGINGAGKSTLIKLLCGLYQPDHGVITVDGTPLADLDPASWAARCSGVFQDFGKLQLPVRTAVGVGDLRRIDVPQAVPNAVERAGAAGLVAALPQGLDTQLGHVFGGVELSHGQWQKLALARAFMREQPLLLVLDEPTAAMDPQAEHDLFETFAQQSRAASTRSGAVTLLVSHRFSTVHMADRIFVLSDGRIVQSGTHSELLAATGPYATLYTAQARAYG